MLTEVRNHSPRFFLSTSNIFAHSHPYKWSVRQFEGGDSYHRMLISWAEFLSSFLVFWDISTTASSSHFLPSSNFNSPHSNPTGTEYWQSSDPSSPETFEKCGSKSEDGACSLSTLGHTDTNAHGVVRLSAHNLFPPYEILILPVYGHSFYGYLCCKLRRRSMLHRYVPVVVVVFTHPCYQNYTWRCRDIILRSLVQE